MVRTAFLPLSGGFLYPDALTVLDTDDDWNTASHALSDGAEGFELGQDAVEVLDLATALAQPDGDRYFLHPEPVVLVTVDAGGARGGDTTSVLFEFLQGEKQAC